MNSLNRAARAGRLSATGWNEALFPEHASVRAPDGNREVPDLGPVYAPGM